MSRCPGSSSGLFRTTSKTLDGHLIRLRTVPSQRGVPEACRAAAQSRLATGRKTFTVRVRLYSAHCTKAESVIFSRLLDWNWTLASQLIRLICRRSILHPATTERCHVLPPARIGGVSMPLPYSANMSLDPQLRALLRRWAMKLVDSDAAADRIVQRTINVVCDSPELLDGARMNEALFSLLRRYAFDENDLRASRRVECASQDFCRPSDRQGTKPQ